MGYSERQWNGARVDGERFSLGRDVQAQPARHPHNGETGPVMEDLFSLRVNGGGFDRYACINDYKRLRRAATTSTFDR